MTDPFEGLPRRHFKAILADPPWGFKCWSGPDKKVASRGTVAPYKTMEMADIKRLPVAELAADDCVLMLWFVWPTLPDALTLISDWGFEYKTCGLCWMKADQYRLFALQEDVRMGLGYWTRSNTEACLLATRGKPKRKDNGVRQGTIEPIREHSRKPDCVHERIERLVDGPYLELFARQSRPGWTTWGNEATKFDKPYDPRADLSGSIALGLETIRERVANGGPGWKRGK
jgi:N6-adenosine-specific RNA methylase IME4